MTSERKKWQVKRVLVGYDGSAGGRDAVELARLLSADGTTVTLVNVRPNPGVLPVGRRLLSYQEWPAAKDLFGVAEKDLAGLDTSARTYVGGSPAGTLTVVAEDEDFDLVVVGSPHRGALGRTLLGSVAEGLLHGSAVPVALAPHGFATSAPRQLGRIGVAVDGTDESQTAQEQAEAIARDAGAELQILTVDGPPEPIADVVAYSFDIPTDGSTILAEALKRAGPDLQVDGELLRGDPTGRALADACVDRIDLLVAGSRGYGPVSRVLMGSVSAQLVNQAPCPVIVVPRPASSVGSNASAER